MINFSGRQFPKDVILCCVRWYVAYPLSYRNLEEIMEEDFQLITQPSIVG